jgi:dihydroflavonol-4-reductase
MGSELVLVTGGSGFVGAHCIVQLLHAGYQVRTTVRSLQREADVRAMLKRAGAEPGAALSFVAADLTADAHWVDAVAGCMYVLHVASPFVLSTPQHEDDLIIPARDGALRVLRAARDAGVKRVVLTSSFVAIGYGHPPTDRPFTEERWTDLTAGVNAYTKSKTLAERAAWAFITREGGALELAVVNPVGVFGPVLGPDLSESIQLVERLMDGTMVGIPRLTFPMVDVRDVADLHLRAMTHPAANGERFLAAADGVITLPDIAQVLRKRMGSAAARVPTRVLPNWLLRSVALVNASVRSIIPELGHVRTVSNEKAKRVLGWTPRSNEESIVATAESLVRLGLLRTSPTAA